MILKTTQTTEHEVEITIPFFRKTFKNGMTEYYAMLTEGYVINAYTSDDMQGASIVPLWIKQHEVIKALNEGVEISEQEFLTEYKRIISSLSLEPTLTETSNNPDDLKGVL